MNIAINYQTPPSSPLLEIQSNNLEQQDGSNTATTSAGLISNTKSLDSFNMFLPFDQYTESNNNQLPSPLSPILNQNGFFLPKSSFSQQKQEFNFLIVDDNQINLAILTKILSKSFNTSCNLTSTTNPLDVLDLLYDSTTPQYDVLFLDIEMPELNGVQIATKIRSIQEKFDHLCIIAVTSCSSAADLELYSNVGIDCTIPKPIALDSEAFRATVLETMEKRRV